MASNLPPGVSGNEYEIAGPDKETEEERTCFKCGLTAIVEVNWYQWQKWFYCEVCDTENDLSSEIPDPFEGFDPEGMETGFEPTTAQEEAEWDGMIGKEFPNA